MLRINLAEKILSLVVSADRAGATVGDLIESRVGAMRFWYAIGSQYLRRAGLWATAAFLAQFYLFFWVGFALRFTVVRLSGSFTLLRWVADLTLLATQILLGYGIARWGSAPSLYSRIVRWASAV